jgi:hypothetical protein
LAFDQQLNRDLSDPPPIGNRQPPMENSALLLIDNGRFSRRAEMSPLPIRYILIKGEHRIDSCEPR